MAGVCAGIDQNDPMMQYYFCAYSNFQSTETCCLAQLMTWILSAYTSNFDDHIELLINKWNEKINERDSIMLSPGISFEIDPEQEWSTTLLDRVDSLQYPEEFRWRLFKLISNPTNYINELAELIRPLSEKLSVELKKLKANEDEFEQYWTSYFDSHAYSDFSLNFCHVDAEFPQSQELSIYIGIMNPASVISEMKSKGCGGWYVQVGWLIDEDIARASSNMIIDDICEILKVLSDKSKFAILQQTNNSPKYGAELAEKLGLTGATISRHMNTLFNCGLITAEKDNTKVYYRTNKQQLANFLQMLNDSLLK